MEPYGWRHRGYYSMLLVAITVGFTSPRCSAEQATTLPKPFTLPVDVDATNLQMDDVLAALSKQAHLNFLVDGVPLLQKAGVRFGGSLKDVLDKVADTFDYTWTLSKHGFVLLSKRFKNPDERPQINLPEMLEMARGMVRALTLVDYDKDEMHWQDLIRGVARTFTQDQNKVLDSGSKLHGSDLSPRQKSDMEAAILSNTFLGTLKLWEGLLPNLENMPNSRLQARKRDTASSDGNAPTHDYLYSYRGANGQLSVVELPHIDYENSNERHVSP